MATIPTPAPRQPARPVMDEWGVYDPQQAGLSALFARLDSSGAGPKAKDDAPRAAAPVAAAAVKEEAPIPPRPSLRDAK